MLHLSVYSPLLTDVSSQLLGLHLLPLATPEDPVFVLSSTAIFIEVQLRRPAHVAT